MRGGMHALVAPVTPGAGLPIEVVKVGKAHARPEALLDHPDTALNLAFGLWRVGAADAGGDANGGQKVGKLGIPLRRFPVHLKKHTFHAVGEEAGGQPLEILAGLHDAADKRGGVAALGEADKPHTRIAEHRRKAVELADLALLLEQEFAPVELQLLAGLGFIAPYRLASATRRTKRLDKVLQDTDRATIALFAQPFEHGLAIEQMVLANPGANLALKRVKFALAARPGCGLRSATQVFAHGVAGDPGLGHNGPN